MEKKGKTPREYRAPALEKGLDIIELFASQKGGLTQTQIAEKLGKTHSEIYRMLEVLCKREYLQKSYQGDYYFLSSKLFALSHQHPPTKMLLDAAMPEMRSLAVETGQSCHLSIKYKFTILIIAQIESPLPYGFTVRIGTQLPLIETASGRVLLAFQPSDVFERWIESAKNHGTEKESLSSLPAKLAAIRKKGFEKKSSSQIKGITDLTFPILDQTSTAVAALSIPFYQKMDKGNFEMKALKAIGDSAKRISKIIGG